MSNSKVKLVAGGAARIFRAADDGRVLVSQIDTGQRSSVDVRHRDVGSYVACDEAGNEVEFVVGEGSEFVTLPVDGK